MHQPVQLLDVVAVETRSRSANGGAGDRAAPAENLLSDREADADLLFLTDQRKIAIENILGVLGAPRGERFAHPHQHFRISKAGHGPVRAAVELLRQVEPAIAAQDADPASHTAVAGAPHLLQLSPARPLRVLETPEGGG